VLATTISFRPELDAWRLSGYGVPVDCAPVAGRHPVGGERRPVSLAGVRTLWLVEDGALDVFAVGAHGLGRWHFLGRLTAGALVPASAPGPEHVLVGRPVPGCALRRIRATELAYGAELASGDRAAMVRAVEAGLRPLLSNVDIAPVAGTPTLVPGQRTELRPGDAARPERGIVWIRVLRGRVGDLEPGDVTVVDDAIASDPGAWLAVGSTGELLASGSLWRHLAAVELRLRYALGRRIAALSGEARVRPARSAA